MKFIDPDTGLSLPVNNPGEICVRSQCVMQGIVPLTKCLPISSWANTWLHIHVWVLRN